MPIVMVEKFSNVALTGNNVPCNPCPISSMETLNSSAATGASERFTVLTGP